MQCLLINIIVVFVAFFHYFLKNIFSFLLSVLTFSYWDCITKTFNTLRHAYIFCFLTAATRWLWMNCNGSGSIALVIVQFLSLIAFTNLCWKKCQTILRYTKVCMYCSRLQSCKFQSWTFIGCNLRILLEGFCNGISLQFGAQHWIYNIHTTSS